MTAMALLEIWIFSELVNKARVVEDCAKKVALARELEEVVALFADYRVTWQGIALVGGIRIWCDTGASQSFIAFDEAVELGLRISDLAFDLHVHTPSLTVVTRLGCRKIPFKIEDRSFVHDLIWLLMRERGAIVAKGYYLNSVMVNCSSEECQCYMLLAANVSGDEQRLDQIFVVRKFPEVFPEDIPEFPPQREIEFVVDLVSGAEPVSIALYKMNLIELAELKIQLDE
ncbi:uncharacterized protein LOC107607246 [Arachis ipaensis]|uniref:uncharacterized protein LOC107607246 n=1 Tax=Arachis ipaensis TaxID=130454 RepID=UPI0007AF4FA8|nr:uncharacterized protein LOC107607246 [Arachis ipaensis]